MQIRVSRRRCCSSDVAPHKQQEGWPLIMYVSVKQLVFTCVFMYAGRISLNITPYLIIYLFILSATMPLMIVVQKYDQLSIIININIHYQILLLLLQQVQL